MKTVARENSLKWKCRGRVFDIGDRPLVMGILNVTPDSFSDGGLAFDHSAALERGMRMAEEGADIIDVGGESTRPGAQEVGAAEEIRRVVPVIRDLCRGTGVSVSVDTTKADVARAAIEAGAEIINDVSALTFDAGMAGVAREYGPGLVLMHMRGNPRNMQDNPEYDDVVKQVAGYLKARIDDLVSAGIDIETMAVDPGLGFGKTVEHNVDLLCGLDKLAELGRPVVAGLSRKSFIGAVTGRPVGDRLAGSIAGFVLSVANGANIMRVHDVRESRDAALMIEVLCKRKRG